MHIDIAGIPTEVNTYEITSTDSVIENIVAKVDTDGISFGWPEGLAETMLTQDLIKLSPNPFREELTIEYTLDRIAEIRLEVLDVTGRTIEVITEGRYGPGKYSYRYKKQNNGIAILRMRKDNNLYYKKIIGID